MNSNINCLVIGVAGVAGSGKDTFAGILKTELESIGLTVGIDHFAKPLKQETKNFCLEKFDIDPDTEDREKKKVIRPILVGHGTARRLATGNTYWWKLLEQRILESEQPDVLLVSDYRHYRHEMDEGGWINSIGGTTVHLSRYDVCNEERIFIPAANETEAVNDPLVKEKADYVLSWGTYEDYEKKCLPYVEKFVQWAIDEGKIPVDKIKI